ncbi:oxidation resistance protein 1 [Dimargaris cristalligena]|nr:oxidation resistance protein 1 [Dimargaris cristalligena]
MHHQQLPDTFEDLYPELHQDTPFAGPLPRSPRRPFLHRRHTACTTTAGTTSSPSSSATLPPTGGATSLLPSSPTSSPLAAPLSPSSQSPASTSSLSSSDSSHASTFPSPSSQPAATSRSRLHSTQRPPALTIIKAREYDFYLPTDTNYTVALNRTPVQWSPPASARAQSEYPSGNARLSCHRTFSQPPPRPHSAYLNTAPSSSLIPTTFTLDHNSGLPARRRLSLVSAEPISLNYPALSMTPHTPSQDTDRLVLATQAGARSYFAPNSGPPASASSVSTTSTTLATTHRASLNTITTNTTVLDLGEWVDRNGLHPGTTGGPPTSTRPPSSSSSTLASFPASHPHPPSTAPTTTTTTSPTPTIDSAYSSSPTIRPTSATYHQIPSIRPPSPAAIVPPFSTDTASDNSSPAHSRQGSVSSLCPSSALLIAPASVPKARLHHSSPRLTAVSGPSWNTGSTSSKSSPPRPATTANTPESTPVLTPRRGSVSFSPSVVPPLPPSHHHRDQPAATDPAASGYPFPTARSAGPSPHLSPRLGTASPPSDSPQPRLRSARRPREKSMLRSVASFLGSGIRRLSNGIGPNEGDDGGLAPSTYGGSGSGDHYRRNAQPQQPPSSRQSVSADPSTRNSPDINGPGDTTGGGLGSTPFWKSALRATRSARTSPTLARSGRELGSTLLRVDEDEDMEAPMGQSRRPPQSGSAATTSASGSKPRSTADYPLRRYKTADVLDSASSYSASTMRSLLLGQSGNSKAPGSKPASPTEWNRGRSRSISNSSTEADRPSIVLADVLALPDLSLLGRRPDSDIVLTDALARKLQAALPVRLRLASSWKLLYSTSQHGISFPTLFRQVQKKGPQLLAIRDTNDHVFGAFLSEPLQPHPSYYGSGECFLWQGIHSETPASGPVPMATTPAPLTTPKARSTAASSSSSSSAADLQALNDVRVFKWKGANEYFILTEPGFLAMGGGDGKFGLYLDSEFDQGYSAWCPTFRNNPLCLPPPPASGVPQGPGGDDGGHGIAAPPAQASLLGLSHAHADDRPLWTSPTATLLESGAETPTEAKFECYHLEVWGIVP